MACENESVLNVAGSRVTVCASHHLIDRMTERGITWKQVSDTLREPVAQLPSSKYGQFSGVFERNGIRVVVRICGRERHLSLSTAIRRHDKDDAA